MRTARYCEPEETNRIYRRSVRTRLRDIEINDVGIELYDVGIK
jgi:hypothetical protein